MGERGEEVDVTHQRSLWAFVILFAVFLSRARLSLTAFFMVSALAEDERQEKIENYNRNTLKDTL